MQDFSLKTYKKLLQELFASGYSFQALQDFIQQPEDKTVILRHDVDRVPENAFVIAEIEQATGIKACYYFRIVKESYDEDIIKKIAEMGHEIGYHYETLTTCGGDFRLAIDDFRLNLAKFREFYPVKTICMHGSPLSKWDNRDLWKKYNYRHFGIIAEPYFDIDFDEVFYLTDTGRGWDGDRVSVRDKIEGTEVGCQKTEDRRQMTDDRGHPSEILPAAGIPSGSFHRVTRSGSGLKTHSFQNFRFRSTFDIIEAAEKGLLPDNIMINTHPQRWTDNPVEWMKELVWQNVKNVVKRYMIKLRD